MKRKAKNKEKIYKSEEALDIRLIKLFLENIDKLSPFERKVIMNTINVHNKFFVKQTPPEGMEFGG